MSKKRSKAQKALDELLNVVDNHMLLDDSQTNEIEVPSVEESTDIVVYEAMAQDDADKKRQREEDLEADYTLARNTLRVVITDAQDALSTAIGTVKETGHPRAIEATSSLLKNIADVSKELLALHKTKQAIDNPKGKPIEPDQKPTVVEKNTYVFTGPTADLNKALDKIEAEEQEEDGDNSV